MLPTTRPKKEFLLAIYPSVRLASHFESPVASIPRGKIRVDGQKIEKCYQMEAKLLLSPTMKSGQVTP